jgi:peptidase MA superfamily protein
MAWGLRPGIPRVTWTTDHFTLTIDEKKQDLLPKLANLAEECYAKESAFFGFPLPGRIQMAFLDEGDYANGYAYAPQEWVVIHLHGADHLLRGRTRWLPGVIAHEIGHIFTLRLMGEDSRFLGMDLFHSWRGRAGSQSEASFSWIYGRVPPWLAEGLAQFAAGVCGYDTLDTHRRMVLRVAAASGSLLSLAELKAFAWDGRRNEMIYAQGYGLVSHLYRAYGPKAVNGYLESARSKGWRGAFKPAFGKNVDAIYADWRKDLEGKSHGAESGGEGDFLLPEKPGPYTVQTFPTPLAGGAFLYLSSEDNDHGQTDLHLADGRGGFREIFPRATSISASSDGRSALFTATRYSLGQSDVVSELYRFSIDNGETDGTGGSGVITRLTSHGRIVRGCQAGGKIYGIRYNEGRTTLVRIENGEWTAIYVPPDSLDLTDIAPGGPTTGGAGGNLTVGATSGFGGDLYDLDLASGDLTVLAASPQDERDPFWHGDTLYFSADYDGAFDVYALAGEQVGRLTHAAGGYFHPLPRGDGLWVSSYGPKGFLLARVKPLAAGAPAEPDEERANAAPRASGEVAPPFVVQLPIPGWKAPPAVEYEADAFDRTSLGLAGWSLAFGVIQSPGYASPETDSVNGGSAFRFQDGMRAVTGAEFQWLNPTGLAEANLRLGLSQPLDYRGPLHLDASAFELRVNAFAPTLLAGGNYETFDLPDVTAGGIRFIYYEGYLSGYLGSELPLSDHWAAAARLDVRDHFGFRGSDGEKVADSDPHFGGTFDLAFADLEYAKDGIARGLAAFARGEMVPKVDARVPDFSATAGASAYASLRRLLFLDASLFHTQDFGEGTEGWVYGGASAYGAIPLGIQLGTRGGAGVFLDQVQPGVEYRNMSRLIRSDEKVTASGSRYPWAGPSAGPERRAQGPGPFDALAMGPRSQGPIGRSGVSGYSPRAGGLHSMIERGTSHEVGFTLSLKTLALFPRPERWTAGILFDALDFGREPAWSVSISL